MLIYDCYILVKKFNLFNSKSNIIMSKSYRIAHISDTHLSRQYYRENIKSFKVLLNYLIAQGIDHLIISGDIVSTGNEEDFLLTKMILESKGLLNSRNLTLVPGNHDIFGSPHRAIDVLKFPQKIMNINYNESVDLFNIAFADSFEDTVFLNLPSLYPFVKVFGPFAFIGLNSVLPWSLFKNPLGSNGGIDNKQFQSLKKLFSSTFIKNKIPIAIMHHHFNELNQYEYEESNIWKFIESKTMKLHNKNKILKIFKEIGVRYIFHGHVHKNELYRKKGIVLANGAGAVCDDPIKYLKYNLLEYSNDYCNIRIIQLPIPYQTSTASQLYNFKYKLDQTSKYSLDPINC